MLRTFLLSCSLILSLVLFSQLKPNDDFHKNLPVQNKVDSIGVFRVANFAPLKYDKIATDIIGDMDLEFSSRGAQIDVYSPGVIENFQYRGETDEMTVLKLEDGKQSLKENVKVFRYIDQNSNRKSYFYYFSDQNNILYRRVSKSKKSDYVVYYLSPK